ncbi:Abi family protein [Arthrobacter flavus]|uniref:Abi family protein n=1 Tax=Arthrobacter flavus TaxID=95172 RepID=A0ABW4Q9A2_9MICC
MTKKIRLSFDGQASLLVKRNLTIGDLEDCTAFLKRVNYYRFSGYARYFQLDPAYGDNTFHPSADFANIRSIYELDHELRTLCMAGLSLVETCLRTQFAYVFSELASPYGDLFQETSFVDSPSDSPVTESILRDLDRSREPYVEHFRNADVKNPKLISYPKMPVWAAVEVFSFGTLSRSLERSKSQDIPKQVAQNLDVAWSGFTSQVKSFVYLRNRCAHHSRLWNHSVIDAPHIPNNVKNRAKKAHGQFGNRSIYVILVALDAFLSRAGLRQDLLLEVESLLLRNEEFRGGIRNPTPPKALVKTEPVAESK